MRIKTYLSSIFVLLALSFIACDDNLNTVGGSIRPGGDDISVKNDTLALTARTISLNDSIYARSIGGLLGEYNDQIFGRIESDYMSEFRLPPSLYASLGDTIFKNAYSVDSVEISVITQGFFGDSTKVVGLTAYELNDTLKNNYFTNINPRDFCDLTKPIGKSSFIYKNTPRPTSSAQTPGYMSAYNNYGYIRYLVTKADTIIGRRFIDEWKNLESTTFRNESDFKKFFPGIYMTMTYGSESLLGLASTHIRIHYKYVGRNVADTADSLRTTAFDLSAGEEVVQMNRVSNKFPQEIQEQLALEKADKTFLKTPAGVCTEVTIPLGQIIKSVRETGYRVNGASFSFKGATEDEVNTKLNRPSNLLVIDKDSVENFFQLKKLENNMSMLLMTRAATNNSYHFSGSGYNLAKMIDHYVSKYKDTEYDPDMKLRFLVIPVSKTTNSTTGVTEAIYNLMEPTSAVLRTDPENLRLALFYSKY